LTALLRAEEIPAFVALLRAGPGHDVEESLPGFGGFDHAIVFVPGAPALWIDPTEPFARAGELPEGDQGRLALVASPDSQALLRLPEAPAGENREVQTREVFLADNGLGRMRLTSDTSGEPARTLRHLVAESSGEAVHQRMEEYFTASELSRAKKLKSFAAADPADLSRPFRLEMETDQSSRCATDRREAVVGIPLVEVLARLPAEIRSEEGEKEKTSRRADYRLREPFVIEVHYRIAPPAGFAPRELPQSRTRALGTATLAESYAAGPDGSVTATLCFDSGKRRLAPQELAALRAAYQALAHEKTVLLAFDQVGEAHLAAGRVREALAEFRRLAAAAPAKAQPHVRLARALLEGGMGTAARAEARRAVALEPRSAEAQATLGWVLEHDDIGRRFGRGFDRAGALAAYRAAKQLDAADQEIRAELAFLLEHDAEGRQFAPRADLAGALAEHRALRDETKSEGVADRIALDLLWLGKPAEAREVLQGTKRLPLALVATALTDGPAAAAREAERREGGAEARLEALKGAAGVLTLLRHYGEAAALLATAGKSSPQAASLLAEAGVLQKARRYEELQIGMGEPAGVARRMLLNLFAPVDGKRDFTALLARRVVEWTRGDPHSWSEIPGWAQESVRRLGLPPEVVLDLALAQAETVVEGDDALGHRVELRVTAGEAKQSWVVFVVREGSEYRLAAFEGVTESLAAEALRRVQAKDWPGARRWLDWTWPTSPVAAGDDPLTAPLVTLLWHKGVAASEEETRCAAAALGAGSPHDDLEPVLTRCREAEKDRLRQAAFDLALATAHRAHQRPAEALAAARRLRAAWPASDLAFQQEIAMLAGLDRWGEMRRTAEERLAARPDDRATLRALLAVAMHQGDFAAIHRLEERLTRAGSPSAQDLNQFAWAALMRGGVAEGDLDVARRATTLAEYKSYASLHTLA
ncbi:MAG TPA: hypothetical protein VGR07_13900, partial [Thermoanaerobaculia bacterium]|nr:hypothetical protein [Thermoanaerobaculia bacterium]